MMNLSKLHKPLGWLLFVAILSSCTRLAYNHVGKNAPKVIKDSVNLSTRYKKTFPETTTGTTSNSDTAVAIKPAKKPHRILNPLTAPITIETIYKDTCRSAIERYNEALEVGYQKGLYDGSQQPPDTFQITITNNKEITIRDRSDLVIAQQDKEKEAKRADKYERKANTRMTVIWCLLGFILLLGLFGFFFGKSLFKSKAKA